MKINKKHSALKQNVTVASTTVSLKNEGTLHNYKHRPQITWAKRAINSMDQQFLYNFITEDVK